MADRQNVVCTYDDVLFSLKKEEKFFKDFIYLLLEGGREREREGEKQQCVVASHMAPTGDLAHNLRMYPDWEPNRWPFGSQPTLNSLSYTSQG